MTQPPQMPDPSPQSPKGSPAINRGRWLILLALMTAGAVTGLAARHWIYTRLVPLVEQSMVAIIDRPVTLGEVENFSLTHVRFGETVLPPTADDADRAIAEAVRVRFNPLELLINRSLSFNVLLVNPTFILEQDADGTWVNTRLQDLEPGAIDFSLDAVRLQDAHVAIIPTDQDAVRPAPGQAFVRERGIPDQWPAIDRPLVWLRAMDGTVRFRNNNDRLLFDVAGAVGDRNRPGTFEVEGELDQTRPTVRARAVLRTDNLPIVEFLPLGPDLPTQMTSGRFNSNVQGSFDAERGVDLRGTAQFHGVTVDAATLPRPVEAGEGQLRFQGRQVQLENASFQFGESLLTARGRIDFQEELQEGYSLIVQGNGLDLNTVLQDADVSLPMDVAGQVNATVQLSGPLEQPVITGTVNQASSIRVGQLSLDTLGARFRLSPEALALNTIQMTPSAGGLIAGSGQVSLMGDMPLAFSFDLAKLPGDAIARPYLPDDGLEDIEIGTLEAGVQVAGTLQRPRVFAQWQALQGTYPAQGNLALTGDRLALRDVVVDVSDGQVVADANVFLDSQQWEAIATLERLSLASFFPDQPGTVEGTMTLAGSLRDVSPGAIEADGTFTLSEAPVLGESLTASVRWVGDGVEVEEAIAPNFQAQGFVGVDVTTGERPTINALDLNVMAQAIDLAEFSEFVPDAATVAGLADVDGTVTGTLEMPSFAGELALQNLVINNLTFAPLLQGTAQLTLGEGGRINIAGGGDRITAVVDDRYYPIAFDIRQGQTVAQGRTQGDRLLTSVENFPLDILNLRPGDSMGLGSVGGRVTGDVSIDVASLDVTDFSTLSASGEVAIANPSLGHIEGDRFTGRVIYGNSIAVVNGGVLTIGESQYGVVGRLSPTSDTLFRGQVTAQEGDIQDLLVAFKYFELPDLLRFFDPPQYGTAADIDLIPIRISDTPLLRQLQRYAEIAALRRLQEKEEEAMFFPELRELTGTVSGTIDVAVSRRGGLTADFDVTGQNWEWGDYRAPNQIIAQGSFSESTITLLPFRFESGDTLINFAGQVGQAEDSQGQLRVENVPATQVAELFRFPISLEGNLNATATVTGRITNPQARGEFSLVDATINQTPIQEATARFSYADARLSLIGDMRVSENDPIRLVGSIPYQLPQGTVTPESDDIDLEIQIENDGLAVLNILNDQVTWNGGLASVSLKVEGTLRQTSDGIDLQPLATGFAELADGSFSAQFLPAPLTGVTGTIQFNRDRIRVNALSGQFSDGEFTAQGIIPLTTPMDIPSTVPEEGTPDSPSDEGNPDREEANPDLNRLTVNLSDLAVNVKGLYNGSVDGLIAVGGTAFAPTIGGEVLLSDGRVSLPDPTVLGILPLTRQTNAPLASLFTPPELEDLQVVLGDRLLITRAPILNFVASGSLIVDGSLTDFQNLRPDGVIRLRSGQVNLFTTQFNLARGQDNVAIFRPSSGVDPFLRVRLATSILEQTRSPIPPSPAFAQSEIIEASSTDFAGVETIRVEASVEGQASQIFQNLELSSSPSRTENEIIALIGGRFVDTQGRGDSNLAIASLAGTALFTSIQNLLSNAIGISDFRIFPAVITDDAREEGSSDAAPTSTLALAAELGVDLTRDLSISALQFLTVEEPTQFSLRYRVNDQVQLRGLTNFSDENRVVIEYEARF